MNTQKPTHGLYWFRDDCRVSDMPALAELSKKVDRLLCVYVVRTEWFTETRWQTIRMGRHRLQFVLQGLRDLDERLKSLGNRLVVVEGDHIEPLKKLIQRFDIDYLGVSQSTGVYESNDIAELSTRFPHLTIISAQSSWLYDRNHLPFDITQLPDSFSAFRRKVERQVKPQDIAADIVELPPPPTNTQHIVAYAPSVDVTDCSVKQQHMGGETAAQDQLEYYLFGSDNVANYKQTRNQMLGWSYSTKLSAWLAAGHLSVRQVFAALQRYEHQRVANESTYWVFFELLWREFFHLHMAKYGKQLFRFGGMNGNHPQTSVDQTKLEQWKLGETGFDIVDACMKQLASSGFISNRGRQLVVSCFVHELNLDWRYGAAYFEQQLIDFDVASNYGNWQYLAGVGCDPRGHRQFNLSKQAEQYDPDGKFRAFWLST